MGLTPALCSTSNQKQPVFAGHEEIYAAAVVERLKTPAGKAGEGGDTFRGFESLKVNVNADIVLVATHFFGKEVSRVQFAVSAPAW